MTAAANGTGVSLGSQDPDDCRARRWNAVLNQTPICDLATTAKLIVQSYGHSM